MQTQGLPTLREQCTYEKAYCQRAVARGGGSWPYSSMGPRRRRIWWALPEGCCAPSFAAAPAASRGLLCALRCREFLG